MQTKQNKYINFDKSHKTTTHSIILTGVKCKFSDDFERFIRRFALAASYSLTEELKGSSSSLLAVLDVTRLNSSSSTVSRKPDVSGATDRERLADLLNVCAEDGDPL